MRLLKAALIGTGAIAREHLAALRQQPGVEIVGIADLSAARAEATAERFEVRRWYTDYRRLLEDVHPEVVHVTTPPDSHFSIVRDCLNGGLHVFCEKPITVEYAEFLELKSLAIERGVMLIENQNLRYHSSVRRMLELAATGELGDVVDVQVQVFLDVAGPGSRYADANDPHPCLSMRGGAIADFLPHIGYLVHIFAGRAVGVRSLWAKRRKGSILPSDEFRALIQGERASASVGFSSSARPPGFWVRVVGTRMQAEANLYEPPRLVLRRLRGGAQPLGGLVDGLAEARAVARTSWLSLWRKLGGTSSYDGLADAVAATYRAVAGEAPVPVPLEEIDAVARLVHAFTAPEYML